MSDLTQTATQPASDTPRDTTLDAPLWTATDIAYATGGEQFGDFACTGVSIDSRTVAKGDLFIALKGPTHDGHDWVASALQAGAAGVLVHRMDEAWRSGPFADRLILVDDTFSALQALGRAARDRFQGTVIGVTGSVGKTSTKEMMALVLSALGPTHAAVGSFNNHWGVPLTLARMPADAAFAVIEMGMNHAGEIHALASIARPHVAVITTIAGAHIEFLGSLQAIADAKAEIFDGMSVGGTAILPADAPFADRLCEAALRHGLQTVSFGEKGSENLHLQTVSITSDHTDVLALIDGHPVSYSIGATGHHWAMNSLAVLGAVKTICPTADALEIACRALAEMHAPKGRGQRHQVIVSQASQPLTVIDEAYNANPTSLRAALAAMAALPRTGATSGRRIAAIGDMLELGPDGANAHAALANAVLDADIDLVFTAGPLSEHLYQALPPERRGGHAIDSAALTPQITDIVRPGDVVMAKGSAGSRMNRVVNALLAMDLSQVSQAKDPSPLGSTKE